GELRHQSRLTVQATLVRVKKQEAEDRVPANPSPRCPCLAEDHTPFTLRRGDCHERGRSGIPVAYTLRSDTLPERLAGGLLPRMASLAAWVGRAASGSGDLGPFECDCRPHVPASLRASLPG